MPTTAWLLPTARTVDAGSGTWTNDANILADDGTEATFSLTSKNATGRWLRGQTFAFDAAIPAGATIDQVQIRMEYRVNSTGGIANPELQAFVGGVAVGAVRAGSPLEPTTLTLNTFDVTADRAWTRADLLDGTFEVRCRGRNGNSTTDPSYRWDYIAAQVTYTEAGVSGTLTAGLPALAAATSGGVEVSGSAAATLPALSVSLAGAADAGAVSGPLAVSLPPLTAGVAGSLGVAGSVGATLPALGASTVGGVEVAGGLAGNLPALGVVLAGSVADDTVRGLVAAGLPALATATVGTLTTPGTLATTLPALSGQFTATADGGPPSGPSDSPTISSTRFGRRVAASRSGAFITATPMRRPSERA